MLYVIAGTDFKKVRSKKNDLIEAMKKRRPGAELIVLQGGNITPRALEEHLGSRGLFEQKSIIVLDGAAEKKEVWKEVEERLSRLEASDNAFLIVEGALDARVIARLKKIAQGTFVFGEKKRTPPSFDLSNAVAARNKKGMWSAYKDALLGDTSPEELHGIIFWQIKALLLAYGSLSAEEAGMKEFPFKKAKQALRNYSPEELHHISKELLYMYHKSHLGEVLLERELERLVLSL